MFKYTIWYSIIMVKKLKCERCGNMAYTRFNGLCPQCVELLDGSEVDVFDVPEKPETVYLWDQKLSLMGTYPDGQDRYMITIPKRHRGNFFIDGSYDIIFRLKTKEV